MPRLVSSAIRRARSCSRARLTPRRRGCSTSGRPRSSRPGRSSRSRPRRTPRWRCSREGQTPGPRRARHARDPLRPRGAADPGVPGRLAVAEAKRDELNRGRLRVNGVHTAARRVRDARREAPVPLDARAGEEVRCRPPDDRGRRRDHEGPARRRAPRRAGPHGRAGRHDCAAGAGPRREAGLARRRAEKEARKRAAGGRGRSGRSGDRRLAGTGVGPLPDEHPLPLRALLQDLCDARDIDLGRHVDRDELRAHRLVSATLMLQQSLQKGLHVPVGQRGADRARGAACGARPSRRRHRAAEPLPPRRRARGRRRRGRCRRRRTGSALDAIPARPERLRPDPIVRWAGLSVRALERHPDPDQALCGVEPVVMRDRPFARRIFYPGPSRAATASARSTPV